MPKKVFEQPDVDSNTVAELSKKLLEANLELQRSENERRKIFENISHDLRAPLTAIRSTIDLLMETERDEKNANLLKILDKRAQNLEELVQNLYYLTKLENGSEKLVFEELPVSFFLEEYFFSAEIDERYADRKLSIEVPEYLDVMVLADANKITRVLDNLFTNAWKYSDSGAEIILGAYSDEEYVSIYVKDSGVGIPKEAIPHVFDRTFRVSKARTPSENSGSGLGLSIVKSIILQHGGSVACESSIGEGSTFTIKLPLIKKKEQ